MNGWHITAPKKVEDRIMDEVFDAQIDTKVMVTKSLITLADVMRYQSADKPNTVLGSYGIGIVSEPGQNLFDLKQGTRVYITPTLACKECYNCKNDEPNKCSDLRIAGNDFHGFLRTFVSTESSNLYYLPDNVTDTDALFIEHVSLSLSIIDKLDVQKGDHVAVLGATNLGIILSQLLIYYQAVPILIDVDEENLEIARKSGIYYTLNKDDNWVKEVSSITGGKMAKSVVYMSDSEITARHAFSLAGYRVPIAITGMLNKNSTISFTTAMKKQLIIHCVNTGFEYTSSSINLLANKACNIKNLKLETIKYADVPAQLEKMSESLEVEEKIYDTIVCVNE